jgi:hypothetical protein
MTVAVRFPASDDADASTVLDELTVIPPDGELTVGDERIVQFLTRLSRRLLNPGLTRKYPQLAPLGFFLRGAALRQALATLAPEPTRLRFPRGLVFHVPPANVDTVFTYSWALAALAGNRNVVRLSPRLGGAAEVVVELMNECLADADPAVRHTQRIVQYNRDDAATAALSIACDLRVVWGGDTSVVALRRFPLAPAARDLTFPDRSSLAVVSAAAWWSEPAKGRKAAAEALATDVYWFGQAACGSPRAVFVVGDDRPDEVRDELAAGVEETVGRLAVDVATATVVHKYAAAYGLAADGTATALRFPANAVTHVDLATGAQVPRRWLGTGMLVWGWLDSLYDLVPLIRRSDQTVAHFGFTSEDLMAFACACGSRGVDRIVPLGRSLQFGPVWDGYDLLHEFTRLMVVTSK